MTTTSPCSHELAYPKPFNYRGKKSFITYMILMVKVFSQRCTARTDPQQFLGMDPMENFANGLWTKEVRYPLPDRKTRKNQTYYKNLQISNIHQCNLMFIYNRSGPNFRQSSLHRTRAIAWKFISLGSSF